MQMIKLINLFSSPSSLFQRYTQKYTYLKKGGILYNVTWRKRL